MQHLCFSFSNKPAVPETSSWYWRRGTKNSAYVCFVIREHLKWCANRLILVSWPKLSTAVTAGTSHPTRSFCWVSAGQSLLPQSGKILDFLFRSCVWVEKKPQTKPNKKPIRWFFPMILLQVAVPCKSSDRGEGSEGVWAHGCTSAVTHSHLTFSCPLFLWQCTSCAMHWSDSGEMSWS